ncbi:hypothetical protein GOODEAATRI_008532 [Goodea atripinnis]|uniref:Death domain-containing protein n=1 Tax=Goodea atripinnis TaxID=208336 RepID=A0ABV0NIM7_9TELE
MQVAVAALLLGFVCHAAEHPAPQWPGEEFRNLTLRRLRTCVENEQYLHQGFCCLNCKEGTFVNKPCEKDLEQGTCLSCEHGQTYTEHPNGMTRCLPCTHCALRCLCCLYSSVTTHQSDESGATAEERQNNQNAGLESDEARPESRPLLQETQAGMTKACPPLEDEDRGLGDSLPNTTSSSQTSLSALPTAASSGNTPHQSPAGFRHLPSDTDDPLGHRLVPLLGSEKSLRKSFDLFDEYLDVRIHNKFFRLIGISDNHIRIAENGPPSDKVYELLKNWMQRQGLKADINDLLEALLSMDQRRSAECIACAAIRRGYYKQADTP